MTESYKIDLKRKRKRKRYYLNKRGVKKTKNVCLYKHFFFVVV